MNPRFLSMNRPALHPGSPGHQLLLDVRAARHEQRRHRTLRGLTVQRVHRAMTVPPGGTSGPRGTLAALGFEGGLDADFGPLVGRHAAHSTQALAKKKQSPPSERRPPGTSDDFRTPAGLGDKGTSREQGSSSSSGSSTSESSTASEACSDGQGRRVACSDDDCRCGPCDSGYVDCDAPVSFKHDPHSPWSMQQEIRNDYKAVIAGTYGEDTLTPGPTTGATCDRYFEEPAWTEAGNCAYTLAGAWGGKHYTQYNLAGATKGIANLADLLGVTLGFEGNSDCSPPCVDERSVDDLLSLDWEAAEDRVIVDMEDWDADLYELIHMAIALILDNEDLLDWAVCLVRGYGGAGCLTRRLDRSQSAGDNPWYIDVRNVTNSYAMLSWPGAQVALWSSKPSGYGYSGSGGFGPKDLTYWPAWRSAAEKGGFTIIDTDHSYIKNLVDMWTRGVPETKVAAVIDCAAVLAHELAHVCNSWDDNLSECPRVDVLETVFQWALATRYIGASASTCYRGIQDEDADFYPMYTRSYSGWDANPAMFASNQDYSGHLIEDCSYAVSGHHAFQHCCNRRRLFLRLLRPIANRGAMSQRLLVL